MRLTSRKQLFALLVGITLACEEGPSGLSSGNLAVNISGLPNGSAADLVVTGPGGYSRGVTGTETLTQLAPGNYAVAANNVTVDAATYIASPATQSLLVGGSTANASVLYSTGAGSLSITINGLGTSSDAAVTVTGPNAFSRSVAESQALTPLPPGTYTIAAQDVVATGGTPHTASPATQDITVPGGGSATAVVTYAPPSSGALNLRIAGLYVTQSAQTFAGSVPLVKDRNGYLRVFAIASRTNTAAPAVRVRIYNSADAVVSTLVIPAPGVSVPTSVDESALVNSWNTPISGTLIQPGFRVDAEVDPVGIVAEIDESDNVLTPPAPVVGTVPTLNVTFVQIVQSNGLTGNVSNANKDEFLSLTRKMYPVAGSNTAVRSTPLIITTDTLEDDNGNQAWNTILAQVEAKRVLENPSGYYYGVAKVSYSSGVAGVAYVSNTRFEGSALGWDHLPSGGAVVAHELGHNWGRNHAPCGGPGGLDNAYPHADGRIGVYGLDVAAQVLNPATTSDIMGYCDPKWIGDYTYKAVMSYLISPPPSAPVVAAAVGQAEQPCLLVWGHIRNGELVLEPSFLVNTRPSLPSRSGPYTLEAKAEDGSNLFGLSFTPSEIADAPGAGQSFVFAVPFSGAQASRLTSLRLAGRGGEVIRKRAMPAAPTPQFNVAGKPQSGQVRRAAGGKVVVRWDPVAHPMVMVRDAETGEVLSFARGGSVQVPSVKREVDLVLSDGVRSTTKRVTVAP